jgi:L-rhamnose mutarotase
LKVFDLNLIDSHYYIKRNTIVEQIQFNNRTFYAKFERIDEPLTPLLLEQHLQREYTIAAPLLEKGYTNYLVIEYKGEEYQRFFHLVKHLLGTLGITQYHIYQGKSEERIQLFIEVDHLSLEEADSRLKELSDMLKTKLTKKWKCLPDISLPEAYNIVTLPYQKLL